MEGTAFSIDEASFDAYLLPEGSRTPGSEAFHRAVNDYFQKSYASMGGQLSVVFAAGRIEVAWEPAPAEASAMATIGPAPTGPVWLTLPVDWQEHRVLRDTARELNRIGGPKQLEG
jgi:hypothetical protein